MHPGGPFATVDAGGVHSYRPLAPEQRTPRHLVRQAARGKQRKPEARFTSICRTSPRGMQHRACVWPTARGRGLPAALGPHERHASVQYKLGRARLVARCTMQDGFLASLRRAMRTPTCNRGPPCAPGAGLHPAGSTTPRRHQGSSPASARGRKRPHEAARGRMELQGATRGHTRPHEAVCIG